MFYRYKYINIYEKQEKVINGLKDLYLPIEVDTEYQQKHFPFKQEKDKQEATISVQMKPITGQASFFLHSDMKKHTNNKTLKVIESDFCVIELLRSYGYTVKQATEEPKEFKVLYIDIFGFFLVVDILRLFKNQWKEDILEIIKNPSKIKGTIKHERRLKSSSKPNGKIEEPYIYTGKYLHVDDGIYSIAISVIDNCALQGNISYENLCLNTNIKMNTKKLIKDREKPYMLQVFKEAPDRFTEYAQGDLMNYEAYQGHTKLFKSLYKILGLTQYYKEPKATIGTSVNNLVFSALQDHFKFESVKKFTQQVKHATHEVLIKNIDSTQLYLAKTSGGRCYNNRPTEPSLKGPIIDIDIKGCYGQGLKLQEYPIGRPIIIDYSIDSNINEYNTLKSFLKTYENELVDGLWFCRISTKTELNFDQDYFLSWYPPERLIEIINTDTRTIEQDFLENTYTNIYSRQLHLAPLQKEGLEWINNCLTKEEREEFLSKCLVITAGIYPKSSRCKTLEEYQKKIQDHKGKNKCIANLKQKKFIIKTFEENYYWYSSNLGDILITKLQKKRALYSKEKPEEKPMNNFIKLVINTVYGDIVSPYFKFGNTIVGNNITGRARAMAWYMEKGLHGTQTITDGCCFQLNRIVKSRYALTNAKYNKIKQYGALKDLTLGPLLSQKINNNEIQILNQKYISDKAKEHIQKTFPKVKVIEDFELEVKEVVTGLSTHGASNYQTRIKDDIRNTKMRSYKNQEYIVYDTEKNIVKGTRNRIENWLNSIYQNPRRVYREEPFVEETIIKTNDYRQQIIRYSEREQIPGDIDYKVRLINECVLSMFQFKTHEQYKSWKKEYEGLRRLYGQSYESFYTNEQGFLNYEQMIIEIQEKLNHGENKYRKQRERMNEHPRLEECNEIQESIKMNLCNII